MRTTGGEKTIPLAADYRALTTKLVAAILFASTSCIMRVAMLFVLVSIKLGFPTLYKAYEFLKSLFRPCRRDCHRKRYVCFASLLVPAELFIVMLSIRNVDAIARNTPTNFLRRISSWDLKHYPIPFYCLLLTVASTAKERRVFNLPSQKATSASSSSRSQDFSKAQESATQFTATIHDSSI
jgi:hypothetical protein